MTSTSFSATNGVDSDPVNNLSFWQNVSMQPAEMHCIMVHENWNEIHPKQKDGQWNRETRTTGQVLLDCPVLKYTGSTFSFLELSSHVGLICACRVSVNLDEIIILQVEGQGEMEMRWEAVRGGKEADYRISAIQPGSNQDIIFLIWRWEIWTASYLIVCLG